MTTSHWNFPSYILMDCLVNANMHLASCLQQVSLQVQQLSSVTSHFIWASPHLNTAVPLRPAGGGGGVFPGAAVHWFFVANLKVTQLVQKSSSFMKPKTTTSQQQNLILCQFNPIPNFTSYL
jgi:hypothetical protein